MGRSDNFIASQSIAVLRLKIIGIVQSVLQCVSNNILNLIHTGFIQTEITGKHIHLDLIKLFSLLENVWADFF